MHILNMNSYALLLFSPVIPLSPGHTATYRNSVTANLNSMSANDFFGIVISTRTTRGLLQESRFIPTYTI